MFAAWAQSLRQSLSEEIVALDGKALRRAKGRGQSACAMVIAPEPKTPVAYKERLKRCKELVHVTVEVHHRDARDQARLGAEMLAAGFVNSGAK